MKVHLDIKRTINYLIRRDDDYINFHDRSNVCNGVFERYHLKALNSVGKMFKIIYFLKVVTQIKFKNLELLITTDNSPLDLLLTKMGTDIIGPRTRFGTAKIDYFYGDTHLEFSIIARFKKYINTLFSKEIEGTFFDELNSALQNQLTRKKKIQSMLVKNPDSDSNDSLPDVEQEIITLSESLKLTKHLQLNIQGLIHEASALRKLHILARQIDFHLKDSLKKQVIINHIEQLATIYFKHETMDYTFSKEEGMRLGENRYTTSEVLKTRGKEVEAIYKALDKLINNLEQDDFESSLISIKKGNATCSVTSMHYKCFLNMLLQESKAYFSVKSEINELLAIDDEKSSVLASRLSLSFSWGGVVGSVGLLIGGALSFTPLTLLGQAVFYTSLSLTLLSLASTACSAAKGLVFDPIKYNVTPKRSDVILLSGLFIGLTLTGSLKLLSSKEVLGRLSLVILTALDSGAKIPLQMRSSASMGKQLRLKNDQSALRSDAFQLKNISPAEILCLARNFLQQKPKKFERILEIMRQGNIADLRFDAIEEVSIRSNDLPVTSNRPCQNDIKLGESSYLLFHSPKSVHRDDSVILQIGDGDELESVEISIV